MRTYIKRKTRGKLLADESVKAHCSRRLVPPDEPTMTCEEFKRRFLPLSRTIYSVALSLTCNAQEAEDAVQDTFMRLWTKRDSLPQVDNAEAYCVTLAKHVCYDRLRSKHIATCDSRPEHSQIPDGGDAAADLERRERSAAIMRCIERLPEKQRLVIMMRDVNEMGFDEISRATGLNETNIRVTLSRARKAIREKFNTSSSYGDKRD